LGRIVFPRFPGHLLRLQGNSSATYTGFHQVLYGFYWFFRIDYLSGLNRTVETNISLENDRTKSA
jgi:hypothetical protein